LQGGKEPYMQRVRQLSVFLENKPGQLFSMAQTLAREGINITAMSIQDATEYIQGMFNKAREVTLRRIASTASYSAILKEASLVTLIRFLTSDPQRSVEVLEKAGYLVNTSEVIALVMDNRPGQLAAVSEMLARAQINIDYTYGSALENAEKALFVFHVSDIDAALEALGSLTGAQI
jgi:hypothetical protein